jgi:hypothetical protein
MFDLFKKKEIKFKDETQFEYEIKVFFTVEISMKYAKDKIIGNFETYEQAENFINKYNYFREGEMLTIRKYYTKEKINEKTI